MKRDEVRLLECPLMEAVDTKASNNVSMEIMDRISGSNLKRKLMSAPVMHFNVDKGDIISETQNGVV